MTTPDVEDQLFDQIIAYGMTLIARAAATVAVVCALVFAGSWWLAPDWSLRSLLGTLAGAGVWLVCRVTARAFRGGGR